MTRKRSRKQAQLKDDSPPEPLVSARSALSFGGASPSPRDTVAASFKLHADQATRLLDATGDLRDLTQLVKLSARPPKGQSLAELIVQQSAHFGSDVAEFYAFLIPQMRTEIANDGINIGPWLKKMHKTVYFPQWTDDLPAAEEAQLHECASCSCQHEAEFYQFLFETFTVTPSLSWTVDEFCLAVRDHKTAVAFSAERLEEAAHRLLSLLRSNSFWRRGKKQKLNQE